MQGVRTGRVRVGVVRLVRAAARAVGDLAYPVRRITSMTRGIPLTPAVRKALVADIRATMGTPEGGLRKLAERNGVSRSTVSRIAMAEGISWTQEGRSKVEKALDQHKLSSAERRARIAERMLDMVEQAIDDMNQATVVYNFGGKDNSYNERVFNRPPTADQRNLATIVGIFTDKHKMLDQYDSDARSGAMLDRWLTAMIGEEDPGGLPPAGR